MAGPARAMVLTKARTLLSSPPLAQVQESDDRRLESRSGDTIRPEQGWQAVYHRRTLAPGSCDPTRS